MKHLALTAYVTVMFVVASIPVLIVTAAAGL